jgi:hypothetical protein
MKRKLRKPAECKFSKADRELAIAAAVVFGLVAIVALAALVWARFSR